MSNRKNDIEPSHWLGETSLLVERKAARLERGMKSRKRQNGAKRYGGDERP
jgi:hypothetical protein